jgi:hypothetical protein
VKEGDERLIALTDAYRTLMDPDSRASYDRGTSHPMLPMPFLLLGSILDLMCDELS